MPVWGARRVDGELGAAHPKGRFVRALEPTPDQNAMPDLARFSDRWMRDCEPQWKRSYHETVACTLRLWIVPALGHWRVDAIDRATVLAFRGAVAGHERAPSPARINKIMSILGACLKESARRFGHADPTEGLRPLRVPVRDIHPLGLDEVRTLLAAADPVWRDYYTVRIFTGLRTGEIDGLLWRYVDLERRQLLVRETLVASRPDTPKTPSSERVVDLLPSVCTALARQFDRTGARGTYVFTATNGQPLRHGNVRRRIWLPLLARAGLAARRPYETRHTYATLMLAAGENPEYIRRQMGHRNSEMLFSVYSRYVRNLTRRDGSAFAAIAEPVAAGVVAVESAGCGRQV